MTARASWRDDAACRGADPDLFFPIGTAGPVRRQIDEAKRICRTCPVQPQCLAWALENGITNGVWAGTTEDERRAIRSRLRTMGISQQDDDGKSYHPAEHGERGIRAHAAQAKTARIFRGAGIGRGSGETGTGAEVTGDTARHQRCRGLVTGKAPPLPAAEDVAHAAAGRLDLPAEAEPAGVNDVRSGNPLEAGFARDFAAADGERVLVAALTSRQFADLVETTGLASIFAFLERLVGADFSACGDLYTHRDTIAALLASWFARHTVADLAAAFAGTSVPWVRLHNLTGRPGSRHYRD